MTPDPYNHKRRIASAAVAYMHTAMCCCHRRDPDDERAVLAAFVDAMVPRELNPQTEGD